MGGDTTETVRVIAQKPGVEAAREWLVNWAQSCELRLDAIDEKPHRTSMEFSVTVAGPADRIDAFREQVSGNAFDDSPGGGTDDVLAIAMVIAETAKSVRKWLRKRKRQRAESQAETSAD